MAPITTLHYLVVAAALFVLGVIGVLTRRNVVIVLMSIELILNAVNLNLVAFSRHVGIARPGLCDFCDHRCGSGSRGRFGNSDCLLPQQRDGECGRSGFDEVVGNTEQRTTDELTTNDMFFLSHIWLIPAAAGLRRDADVFLRPQAAEIDSQRRLRRSRGSGLYFLLLGGLAVHRLRSRQPRQAVSDHPLHLARFRRCRRGHPRPCRQRTQT